MSIDKLLDLYHTPNIADKLDDEELLKLGNLCYDEYMFDKGSRASWDTQYEKVLKLAQLIGETKTYPWPNAANIKYPLLTDAVVKFASRQYPQIVQGNKVVHCAVVGDDPTGNLGEAASAISAHMSSQLLVQSNSWESTMDRLLHVFPVAGTVFKKVYYDPIERHNQTDLCTPDTIIINNDITTIKDARRITHILYKHANYIKSMMNQGLYCDIDLKELEEEGSTQDKDKPFKLCEQHRYLDLDEDGYQEPYIVTFHERSRKVLRISPCFDMKNVKLSDDKKKVIHIKPTKYFIDYHFIPSPDGKFYSLGYGMLLYPINEVLNSTFNQLLDSATLHNTQGGFLLKGVRIKNGQIEVHQGKWNVVDAPSLDLKSSILPFPTKEPSAVLLQLISVILNAGKELASITEVANGTQPGQNVAAQTIMTLLQQSLTVPNAVQKRFWRSLKAEFECLAELNRKYMDTYEDFQLAGKNYRILKEYYNMVGISIEPVADPNASSESLRALRSQAVLQVANELSSAGKQESLELYFKNLQLPDDTIKKLLAPDQNPQPSPEMIKVQNESKELQLKALGESVEKETDRVRLELEMKKCDTAEKEAMARIELMRAQAQAATAQATLSIATASHDASIKKLEKELEFLTHKLEERRVDNEEKQLKLDSIEDTNEPESE